LDEGLDTVVHILGKFNFIAAESSKVRNIESAVIALGVLAVNSTNLDEVLVSNLLELRLVLSKLWKFNVDRGTHTSTKVGRAG